MVLFTLSNLTGCATAEAPPVAVSPNASDATPSIAKDISNEIADGILPGAPAANNLALPNPIDDLLANIEASTQAIRTLHARLRYTTIQGLLEDEQIRFGELWYAAPGSFSDDDPNMTAERLAVHLQRESIDGPIVPADQWLIFDGDWFLDRDAQAQRATRRGLRPLGNADQAQADQAPAAALPVPIRFNRAEAQQRYDIMLVAAEDRAPNAAPGITLNFTPKDHAPADAEPVRITFDEHTHFPLEIRFGQPGEDQTIFRLIEPTLDPPTITRDQFNTALPDAPGWDNQLVPFGQ